MRLPTAVAIACSVLSAGCGADADLGGAARVVADLEAALRAGREPACRRLVTEESAAAIAALPWAALAERQALVVLGAERGPDGLRVAVRDPNDGGRRSEFVVVRENGRLVVDLVATAGLCSEAVEAGAPREQFVPRELSPADFDRIRQHELAQPRR